MGPVYRRWTLLQLRQLRMPVFFNPESEMALGKIADGNNKEDSNHLADEGIPVQHFHQQFKHAIIEDEVKTE